MSKIVPDSSSKTNSKQLVFIDDSGDPGIKFRAGSNQYFLLAAIVFDRANDAENCTKTINQFKKQHNIPLNLELKFHTLKKEYVIKLLQLLTKKKYRIYAVVVDKTNLKIKVKEHHKINFYYQTLAQRLVTLELTSAVVFSDGRNDRNYQLKIKTYLRKKVNTYSQKIVEFTIVNSKNNTLIQFADIIAGSIFRSLNNTKSDQFDYLSIIQSHITKIRYL